MMRKYRLLLVAAFVLQSFSADAQVCEVSAPSDFLEQFSNLADGDCNTLTFTKSMEIHLQRPLVLEKSGDPIRIETAARATVRIRGDSFTNNDPALTISRSQVTLSHITFENFPSNAIVANGDQIILEKIVFKNNGRLGASALVLTGNDISVVESEIFESGTNGIVITEDLWPPSCHLAVPSKKAKNILLRDNKIHRNGNPDFSSKTCADLAENRYDNLICKSIALSKVENQPYAGYGVVVDGYQVRMESSEPGKFSINNNARAGIFFQSFSAPYFCKTSKILHSYSLSKVSVDKIIALGPLFPKPSHLSVREGLGGWIVSGVVEFSKEAENPYKLGPVAPRNLEIEIFSAPQEASEEGAPKKYLGATKDVQDDGSFLVELDKAALSSDKDLVVAIATDTILNISSTFSSLPGEDEISDENPETPEIPEAAPIDTDGDGVTDKFEIDQLKTDPEICDTDGDGLGDGLESGYVNSDAKNPSCRGVPASGSNFRNIENLDPKRKDSDQDGLVDGEEDKNKNGWVDFDETDPTLKDSDADGLEDGFENHLGSEGVLGHLELSAISNGEKCSPPPDRSDIDCDGFINARDEDSDDDGCLDREEGLRDQNENGIADLWEQAMRGCGASSGSSSPSSSSKPSAGISPDPDEAEDETGGKTLAQEGVVPMSRGGGACALSQGAQKNIGFLFLIGFLFFALSILRLNYFDSIGRGPRNQS